VVQGTRIKMYHNNVNSIIDYYASVGRKISGNRSKEVIFEVSRVLPVCCQGVVSVLSVCCQCVAVCVCHWVASVLQCVASLLQCSRFSDTRSKGALLKPAVCCNVLQCVAVYCNVLRVLQYCAIKRQF